MTSVSFIIPYHRGISYLADALSSIISLDLEEYEVVVIYDSMSKTIGCEQIREEVDPVTFINENFQNSSIKIIPLCNKQGVCAARNLGMKEATKEYIYFLDADDYVIKEGFKSMLQAASSYHADLVYSPYCTTWFKRDTFLERIKAEDYEDRERDLIPKRCLLRYKQSQERLISMGRIDAILHIGKGQVSSINMLMNRSWLIKNRLSFDETQIFYPDMEFVTKAILSAKEEGGIYFSYTISYGKRLHNDPILNPSLSQIKSFSRPQQYLSAYVKTKENLEKHLSSIDMRNALQFLHLDLLKFILLCYRGGFHKSSSKIMPPSVLDAFMTLVREVPSSLYLEFDQQDQQLFKQIAMGHSEKACKLANRQFIKQKKQGLFGNQIQRARVLQKVLFNRMKVKENWIMFESFGGKSYSDNCKYIYQYMLAHYGKEYRYIWVIKDDSVEIPGNPVRVKPNTYQYVYYMTRAKYKVFNSRQPDWYSNREGMVFIQTWHGTPLKRLVFDMEDVHSASMSHKADFYKVSRKWGYLLSDNRFSTEVFAHAFLFEKNKIVETGYPRNDVLCGNHKQSMVDQIKSSLQIPLDKKVILYAPTWRDDDYYASGQYKFQLELDVALLKERLGGEYVMLLRTHYFVVDQVDSLCKDPFLYNGSRYEDVSELYLISDICITDYSSVFFDYANLKRPLLFYAYDFKKYKDELHGFYIDMETELPGPLLTTSEQLVEAIENIEKIRSQYKDKYDEFFARFCSLDDGHASQRVVEQLIRKNNKRG